MRFEPLVAPICRYYQSGVTALSVGGIIIFTVIFSALLASGAHRLGWIATPDATRRIGCIDGLRGYLALFVFIHHFFVWRHFLQTGGWYSPKGNFYANMGQGSVAVFFMITAVLFYPKITRRLSDVEWIAHFISRIFRLTPLLWLATAIVAAVIFASHGLRLPTGFASEIIALLKWLFFVGTPDLFGQPDSERIIASVTWSLTYEWGFYVFLPAFSYFLYAFRKRISPLPILFCAIIFFEWAIIRHYVGPQYYILFAVGLLVAESIRNAKVVALLRTPWASAVGIAALLAEAFLFPTALGAWQPVLLGIFFAPAAAGNSYFGAISRTGSIVLGEISYGIYLLHGIVLYVAMNVLLSPAALPNGPLPLYLLPVLAILVIALALVAYRTVEAPGIDLGRRIIRRLRQKGAVASVRNDAGVAPVAVPTGTETLS